MSHWENVWKQLFGIYFIKKTPKPTLCSNDRGHKNSTTSFFFFFFSFLLPLLSLAQPYVSGVSFVLNSDTYLKRKENQKKPRWFCVLCCAPYNWVLGAKNILKMCLGSSTSCYLISVLLSMKRIWSVTEELGRGSSETRMSSALEADLGLLVN